MATRVSDAGEVRPAGRRKAGVLGALAVAVVLAAGGLAAWKLGWFTHAPEAALDTSVPIDDPTGAKSKMSFTIASVTPDTISLRVANLGENAARLSRTTLRYVIWDKANAELRIFGLDLRLKDAERSPDVVLNAGEDRLLNFDYFGLLDESAIPDQKTEGELALLTVRPPNKAQYLTKRSIGQAELRTYVEGHLKQ